MSILLCSWILLLFLNWTAPSEAQTGANQFLKKRNKLLPQHFYYDYSGIMTINGSVPGMSEVITLSPRALAQHCLDKNYYKLTFCPLDKQAFNEKHRVCSKGIMFCYESQLREGNARATYVLSKYHNDDSKKCDSFSGFKVAMHYINKKYYLEVTTTFIYDSYYFPLPDTKCLDLWLGNDRSLTTTVRTLEDRTMVRPERVMFGKKWFGREYAGNAQQAQQEYEWDFSNITDFNNLEPFAEQPHLNMLYLDFQAPYPKIQQMFTVHPEDGKCNMIVRLRSQSVGTCKSQFKQKKFALKAYSWGNTSYVLTLASGYETERKVGSSKTQTQETSESTETGQETTDETSEMSALQQEDESVMEERDESSSSHMTQSEKGLGAKATASGGAGPAKGSLEAGGNIKKVQGSSESLAEMHSRSTSRSTMDYSSTTIGSVLSNAYSRTSTISSVTSTKTTQTKTVGVTRRTMFKWTVNVPPGKILTPMQMHMDCHGLAVKIPWIRFILADGEGDTPVTELEGEYDDDE